MALTVEPAWGVGAEPRTLDRDPQYLIYKVSTPLADAVDETATVCVLPEDTLILDAFVNVTEIVTGAIATFRLRIGATDPDDYFFEGTVGQWAGIGQDNGTMPNCDIQGPFTEEKTVTLLVDKTGTFTSTAGIAYIHLLVSRTAFPDSGA